MKLTTLREKLKPPCDVLDVHVHPLGTGTASVETDARRILEAAGRAGITKMCIFLLHPESGAGSPLHDPAMRHCRDGNDYNLRMRDRAPEAFLPFCYVNPACPEASVDEINRCIVEERMCGIKLWVARRATDAGLDPIMQRAVELDVPVLQHAWDKTTGNLPGESFPQDVAHLARRHPGAKIIMAHLNGCGLRGIEHVADCPNLVADTGGGDPEAGIVETAVDALGGRRVVFGSDLPVRLFGQCLGKTLGADLSEATRKDILWNNAARLLPDWAGVKPL
ncbi:MAG: amidohydrolase family protein [Gemmatimonadetes bacterium]|nr:amidohydrolase family protein [Gemmatimonadota bacterium]